MPFLPIDVDGKKRWPAVASGCRIPLANVALGFANLWEQVWLSKKDTVTALQLECLFDAVHGQRVAEVLTAFDFLEPLGDVWRVRGAKKFLGVTTSRSEAGKVSAARPRDELGRLLPAGSATSASGPADGPEDNQETSGTPAPSQQMLEPPSSTQPTNDQLLHPTPNTQHPIKNLCGKPARPKKHRKEKPTNPRHAPMVRLLKETFAEVVGGLLQFDGQDAKALSELLSLEPDDAEILRRWVVALRRDAYPRVRRVWELAKNWNHFADGRLAPRSGDAPEMELTSGNCCICMRGFGWLGQCEGVAMCGECISRWMQSEESRREDLDFRQRFRAWREKQPELKTQEAAP